MLPLSTVSRKIHKGSNNFLGEEPEKTHDLSKLFNVIRKYIDIPIEFRQFAIQLTQFGVQTRYPNAIDVDEDTTKLAIAQAEQVKIWAEKIIAEKSNMQSGQEDETADTTTD